MKKLIKGLGVLLLLIIVIYLVGPRVKFDKVDPTPFSYDYSPEAVEQILLDRDAKVMDLKKGNESQVIWANELKSKTEYVVLYLHGFSASRAEGEAVYPQFAQSINANVLAPRLYDSGRESDDTFKDLTPKLMMDSAKDAIALAKCLGEKIIVVSCSTGGTYSAYLSGYDDRIVAQVLMSPNIELYDKKSTLVIKPWGRKLLNVLQGGEYNHIEHYNEAQKQFWNPTYHNDGILALVDLLDQTMKAEHFEKIHIPTLLIAFYQNEEVQDKVVSVERMRQFMSEISTPKDSRRFVECQTCSNHVVGSKYFETDVAFIENEMRSFVSEVLKINPAENLEIEQVEEVQALIN